MKFIFLLTLLFSFVNAFETTIINDEVGNGKTALIKFSQEKHVIYKEIIFDKKRMKIFKNPFGTKEFYALLPVSYYTKPGKKKITILYLKNDVKKSKIVYLHVVDAKYKKETIHVKSSQVHPKRPAVKKRIAKEYTQAMKIYNTVSAKSYIHSDFILPLHSDITSAFGTARVYNGSLKGYHSGTDFRAKMGTPIRASNDGEVVLVKKRFYSGGTVIINHGEGIYSCYFHMSKFNVTVHERVQKGELLGLSGKSGRVTGPHLHFSARIDGVQVDPLQLISLLNNNLILKK